MTPEINYWAVLLATASSMVVGSIWYSRWVFGARWARLADVDLDRPATSATLPIITTVLVSFVTAWVLAGATPIAWNFSAAQVRSTTFNGASPRIMRSACV